MLHRANRLTAPGDFTAVVRRGVRAGGPLLVLHLLPASPGAPSAGPRIGFVVSKAVGPAVIRNRVRRRLREIARAELPGLTEGTRLVVRVQPAAAEASYAALQHAWRRGLVRLSQPGRPGRPEAAGVHA